MYTSHSVLEHIANKIEAKRRVIEKLESSKARNTELTLAKTKIELNTLAALRDDILYMKIDKV